MTVSSMLTLSVYHIPALAMSKSVQFLRLTSLQYHKGYLYLKSVVSISSFLHSLSGDSPTSNTESLILASIV